MAYNTVVQDGDLELNINGSAETQVIRQDGGEVVKILIDGDPCLVIPGEAHAAVRIVQDGTAGVVTEIHTGDMPWYDGPTEITPSEEAQILPTSGKGVASNIVVNAIPSNYGRIAWDGTKLTVY